MIHTIGDSHALYSFAGLPGITTHTIGPVTLKRAGYLEDELLPKAVAALALTPTDVLICCFGEPDCRCFIHPQAIRPRHNDLDVILPPWVDRYLDRLTTLPLHGARLVVFNVPPPTTYEQACNKLLPAAGSDAERASYTRRLNHLLQTRCAQRQILYLNVYDYYATPDGMLNPLFSDGGVHIGNPTGVYEALQALRLLP